MINLLEITYDRLCNKFKAHKLSYTKLVKFEEKMCKNYELFFVSLN